MLCLFSFHSHRERMGAGREVCAHDCTQKDARFTQVLRVCTQYAQAYLSQAHTSECCFVTFPRNTMSWFSWHANIKLRVIKYTLRAPQVRVKQLWSCLNYFWRTYPKILNVWYQEYLLLFSQQYRPYGWLSQANIHIYEGVCFRDLLFLHVWPHSWHWFNIFNDDDTMTPTISITFACTSYVLKSNGALYLCFTATDFYKSWSATWVGTGILKGKTSHWFFSVFVYSLWCSNQLRYYLAKKTVRPSL